MKSTLFKLLVVTLVLCMIVPMAASCGKKYTGGDTLVVGYSPFSEKFSPFFSKTAYDADVAAMTQLGLLTSDREGNIVLEGKTGETRAYNGKDYDYKGLSDCEITINDDGTVVYEFDLRKNVKFSDGVKLTADDVIFSIYVLSDPTYDGSSTFYSLPIKGMTEYRTGVNSDIYDKYAAIADAIYEAGMDKLSTAANVTQALTDAYWGASLQAGGEKFAQEIVDYCTSKYAQYSADVKNSEVALGMYVWGFGEPSEDGTTIKGTKTGETYNTATVTLADYWTELKAGYTTDGKVDYAKLSSTETAASDLFDLVKNAFISSEGPKDTASGGAIMTITGVEKTGDYSIKVTMTKYDAAAIYQLSLSVAPLHYYGDTAKYDYENNMFGFTKGDLSGVKSKTTNPMGAGAYKFVNFENGIVTFERNENYYKGAPKITYIKFQEITDDADKVSSMISGTIDVSDPSISAAIVESIKGANTEKTLNGDVITYSAVDNLGYGYIGINADNVKVGADKASEASKNLRKGFATLFAIYRDSVINSYYQERASVIQYPISNTSWAAPRPSDSGYAIAYSKNADGTAIYTDGMSEEQKYAAAIEAATGFFKSAGYTWDDAAKKFTKAPDGASLTYEVIIPAGGKGDHPAYGILTSVKEALAGIGITLTINDPTDTNVLWNSLEAGTCSMWAAAWGATLDPDMYQVYHSSNIVGKGGTDSNHYAIADSELDEKIMAARTSADQSYRKATYKQCLDIILDWGVEVPTYQRQNCIIFSTQRINVSTLTPDITTFWGWMNDIELLEMN